VLPEVLQRLQVELLRPVEVAFVDRDASQLGEAPALLGLVADLAKELEGCCPELLRAVDVTLAIGVERRVDEYPRA